MEGCFSLSSQRSQRQVHTHGHLWHRISSSVSYQAQPTFRMGITVECTCSERGTTGDHSEGLVKDSGNIKMDFHLSLGGGRARSKDKNMDNERSC